MSAVWVVRDALSDIQAAFPTEKAAVNYTHKWVGDGLITITRETLLTPEQAAKAHIDDPELFDSETYAALVDAVRTLRAQEGE